MLLFKPGDWAVLKHDSGGRLFEVTAVEPVTREDGRYKVTEASWQPQYPHKVWNHQLIMVKDREEAIRLVAVLDYINKVYEARQNKINKEMRDEFTNVIKIFELNQGEE